MMYGSVVARWDGFLARLRERHDLVLREGEHECRAASRHGGDLSPLGRAWIATSARADELEVKLEQAWNDEVEPAFEEAGADEFVVAQEREKGYRLRVFMEVERERTRVRVYADAARALFDTTPHAPETLSHALCEEAAFTEWLAKEHAARAARQARDVTIHQLKHWERAEIAYLHAYLRARAQIVPESARAFEREMTGRMRHFYDSMEREPAWVSAGRPREVR